MLMHFETPLTDNNNIFIDKLTNNSFYWTTLTNFLSSGPACMLCRICKCHVFDSFLLCFQLTNSQQKMSCSPLFSTKSSVYHYNLSGKYAITMFNSIWKRRSSWLNLFEWLQCNDDATRQALKFICHLTNEKKRKKPLGCVKP